MKRKANILILPLLALAALIGAVTIYAYSRQQQATSITDFESCAAAGYPIMESYPERCATPDGRTFTRDISTLPSSTSAPAENAMPTEPPNGQPITLSGTLSCLPHKNPNGPQTLECAMGLKTSEGMYYALQDSDPSYSNLTAPMGDGITVDGILTDMPPSRYQSEGLIYIKSVSPSR